MRENPANDKTFRKYWVNQTNVALGLGVSL